MACCAASAARSASSSAFRSASANAPIAISASSRACRAATGLLDVGWLRLQRGELGVELVADLLLLALLAFEVGLLVLELRVDRREPLHDVVVGLVGLVEQLLPAGGVDRVGGVDERFELIARVRVGEHARACGRMSRSSSARAFVVAIESSRSAMSLAVSSSSWSASENAAAGSLAAGAGVGRASGARRRGRPRWPRPPRGRDEHAPRVRRARRGGRTSEGQGSSQGLSVRGTGHASSR